jgi:diadenylate cyclase
MAQTPADNDDDALEREMVRNALGLASKRDVSWLLCVCDAALNTAELKRKKLFKKTIYAVSSQALAAPLLEQGFKVVVMPPFVYTRQERVKVSILNAISQEIVQTGERVVCITGRVPGRNIDTVMRINIGEETEERTSMNLVDLAEDISTQLLEIVIELAMKIGQEGYEGRPVGTLITIGDATQVMEASRQIILNPFQGYSENERNLLDPQVRESVRSFAVLDGAIVVREDGVVLSAGRYLLVGNHDLKLPLGFGARHNAGASMSYETKAICVVVSQTSGTVRVFKGGELALEISPASRRL